MGRHLLHREPQDSQFPLLVKKKPSAQVLHWVLFAPPLVAQPGEQVQVFPEHTPLVQLQVEGAPAGIGGLRQTPVPVIPLSHLAHPAGQAGK
jgi:hypothetical protein